MLNDDWLVELDNIDLDDDVENEFTDVIDVEDNVDSEDDEIVSEILDSLDSLDTLDSFELSGIIGILGLGICLIILPQTLIFGITIPVTSLSFIDFDVLHFELI